MKPRTFVQSLLAAVALTACSHAGGSSTPPAPAATMPQTTPAATGTLTIAVPAAAADALRRPAFISSATTQAALFIDGVTAAAASSSSCSSGCTLNYTTTAGTHTFRAEIANSSHVVLAAGSKSIAVLPGAGNNITLTLNGAAATALWVSTTSTTAGTISGTYAIEDASSVLITSAPAGA